MGYFILDDIENLAITLAERVCTLVGESPYGKKSVVLIVKCKNKEERNALLTELICEGYDLKGIVSKNGLWIKITNEDVYIETTKSLFTECEHPVYDEIYLHRNSMPSKDFVKMLKDNGVKYKHIKPFCFYDEHIAYTNKKDEKKQNKNQEKSKKEIPEALKGLEVSEDLHSFKYNFGKDGNEGTISFYTSEKIDKDILEELIRKIF